MWREEGRRGSRDSTGAVAGSWAIPRLRAKGRVNQGVRSRAGLGSLAWGLT